MEDSKSSEETWKPSPTLLIHTRGEPSVYWSLVGYLQKYTYRQMREALDKI